jgi:hypothetical protein
MLLHRAIQNHPGGSIVSKITALKSLVRAQARALLGTPTWQQKKAKSFRHASAIRSRDLVDDGNNSIGACPRGNT